MTRFDADSTTVAGEDSTVSEAATLTDRVLGRNVLVVKAALFFAAMLALSYVAYGLAGSHELRQLAAIAKWFTVMFMVCATLLALVVKSVGAVQRHRRGV